MDEEEDLGGLRCLGKERRADPEGLVLACRARKGQHKWAEEAVILPNERMVSSQHPEQYAPLFHAWARYFYITNENLVSHSRFIFPSAVPLRGEQTEKNTKQQKSGNAKKDREKALNFRSM